MIELADEKTPDKASKLENQKNLGTEGESTLSKVGERTCRCTSIEGKNTLLREFSNITRAGFIRALQLLLLYH